MSIHKGFIVTFENPVSGEEASQIQSAICTLKNIASVIPVEMNVDDAINREAILSEIRMKLFRCLYEERKGEK